MRQQVWRAIRDYGVITVGALLSATAARSFLVPNEVVAGGITGIAIMLNSMMALPIGWLIIAFNIPLFIFGFRMLGGLKFALRTIYATVLLAFGIDYIAPFMPIVTDDPLLYSIYGGLLDGIGMGLVLRVGGTTGGTDIIARIVERRYGVAPGRVILMLDVAIYVGAFFLYGPEKALYALIVAFIATRVIDATLAAGKGSRQLFIITNAPDAIVRDVFAELGRGVTLLEGRGGYTHRKRQILVCAVARSEVGVIKSIVTTHDPKAFVIIGEALEVMGEGFTHPSTLPNSPVPLASEFTTLPLDAEDDRVVPPAV
ncbi:MAG: YitT family protein [Chloroflexi bacterium]|nr:YitT family protein [Chloroflexota bacterium]